MLLGAGGCSNCLQETTVLTRPGGTLASHGYLLANWDLITMVLTAPLVFCLLLSPLRDNERRCRWWKLHAEVRPIWGGWRAVWGETENRRDRGTQRLGLDCIGTDPFQVRTQLQMSSCAGCGAAQYPTGLAWCGVCDVAGKIKPIIVPIGCFVWSFSSYSPTWHLLWASPNAPPAGEEGAGVVAIIPSSRDGIITSGPGWPALFSLSPPGASERTQTKALWVACFTLYFVSSACSHLLPLWLETMRCIVSRLFL